MFDWVSVSIGMLSTLGVGGWLGHLLSGWLTSRRERAKRRVEFCTRQLDEFYGPLLSLHKEIRARGELRVKIQEKISTKESLYILQIVDDENKTLGVLMPRYQEMVNVFRTKMWLAEPETRVHFPVLIEFVDVWDKILSDRLPREIAPAIGHTEANLKPFYSHLEATHDRLRSEID
jgi:hypothetical protein